MIRLGLLALLILWTFLIIRPFVPILAWSAVLAVAFIRLRGRLAKRLGGRRRTAGVHSHAGHELGIVIWSAAWSA